MSEQDKTRYKPVKSAREAYERLCDNQRANETSDYNIKTLHMHPPIRINIQWCAHLDGYEPGCPIGYGSTEEAAVDDLKWQLEEKEQ